MSELTHAAPRAAVPTVRRSARRQRLRESLEYYSLMAPAVILFTVFVVYPVLGGIFYSFTDWNGIEQNYNLIGLQNYVTFFTDFYVIVPLINTLIFAFVLTLVQNIVSLALAIALERRLFTKNILRTLIFIPVLLSPLMVGYLWNYLFSEPIASFGKSIGLDILGKNLLGNPSTALYAGVFVTVWRMLGWTMVVYIAALQAIPRELYEAASMDGGSGWKRFLHITFPLIAPAFTVNMVVTMERGLKEFDLLFALTKGGPGNSSEVLSLTIFRESFEYYRAGYGTTMGVMLFFIIIAISIIQLVVLRKKEENVVY